MADNSILTARQQQMLRCVADAGDIARDYVLTGGTALAAFYLRHRLSDDLDFFTRQLVDFNRVIRFMEESRDHLKPRELSWQTLYDRRIFQMQFPVGEVLKVEFTQFPYHRLAEPTQHDGILIDSLPDIAAGKLMALLDRNEPKDFYDLYFLLSEGHTTLPAMLKDAEKKFQRAIHPFQLGAQLALSKHLPILPHLLKPVDQGDMQRFFEDLMKSLRPKVIEE